MTTDQLLFRAAFLLRARDTGHINGRVLTRADYDWLDGELMAIDAELDHRRPENGPVCIGIEEEDITGILPYPLTVRVDGNVPKFQALLGEDGEAIGFERIA